MQKKLFDAKTAHIIVAIIGLFFTWSGVDGIYLAVNGEVVFAPPAFSIGMVIFGSMLMGAALQSFFRVRKQMRTQPKLKDKK